MALAVKGRRWFREECERLREGGADIARFNGLQLGRRCMAELRASIKRNVEGRARLAYSRRGSMYEHPGEERLQNLLFEWCRCEEEDLNTLLRALVPCRHLNTLSLRGCAVTPCVAAGLSALVMRSRSLRKLDLSAIEAGTTREFWEAIRDSPIESINLSGGVDGTATLVHFADVCTASALPRLTHLDLSCTGIEPAGGNALKMIIAADPGLTTLLLRGNRLGGGLGAAGVGAAFECNATLVHLDLEDTDLTEDDAFNLALGVQANESMTILKLRGGANVCDAKTWGMVTAACYRNARAKEKRVGVERREREREAWSPYTPSPPGSPAVERRGGPAQGAGGSGYTTHERHHATHSPASYRSGGGAGRGGRFAGSTSRAASSAYYSARTGTATFTGTRTGVASPYALRADDFTRGASVVAQFLDEPPYNILNGLVGTLRVANIGADPRVKAEVSFPAPIGDILLPLRNLRPLGETDAVNVLSPSTSAGSAPDVVAALTPGAGEVSPPTQRALHLQYASASPARSRGARSPLPAAATSPLSRRTGYVMPEYARW